jgi:hypothetical protein
MKPITDDERSAFHARFCPFADRIYRGALILAGNSQSAERLQVDIYLKAFVEYLLADNIANFENWLVEIVRECFDGYEPQDSEIYFEANAVDKLDYLTLEKLVNCKKMARRQNMKTGVQA